jgi:hypothetical protein
MSDERPEVPAGRTICIWRSNAGELSALVEGDTIYPCFVTPDGQAQFLAWNPITELLDSWEPNLAPAASLIAAMSEAWNIALRHPSIRMKQ